MRRLISAALAASFVLMSCNLPYALQGTRCVPEGAFAQDNAYLLKCQRGWWTPGLFIQEPDPAMPAPSGLGDGIYVLGPGPGQMPRGLYTTMTPGSGKGSCSFVQRDAGGATVGAWERHGGRLFLQTHPSATTVELRSQFSNTASSRPCSWTGSFQGPQSFPATAPDFRVDGWQSWWFDQEVLSPSGRRSEGRGTYRAGHEAQYGRVGLFPRREYLTGVNGCPDGGYFCGFSYNTSCYLVGLNDLTGAPGSAVVIAFKSGGGWDFQPPFVAFYTSGCEVST
jgi:hypothetical protein